MRMFLPGCFFSLRTSSTTLPPIRVEFRQAAADFNVVDTTTCGCCSSVCEWITGRHRLERAAVDLPGLSAQQERIGLFIA